MDAKEIIKNGVILKNTPLKQNCAICNTPLKMKVYRYMGRVNRKIVCCEKCDTASWINKKENINLPKVPSIEEMMKKDKR